EVQLSRSAGGGRVIQPLADSQLLVAKVMRREAAPETVARALDYRGVPVIGTVTPIKGTDMWLVTNSDLADVEGPARRTANFILAVAVVLTLTLGIASWVLRQRQAIREGTRHRDELQHEVAERTRELNAANDSLQGALRFNRAISDAIPGRVAYLDA